MDQPCEIRLVSVTGDKHGIAFCAGFETDGSVIRAAPVIGFLVGWTDAACRDYFDKAGWQVAVADRYSGRAS